MNYSKLNEGLDEYLQKYENTFYVSNLDMNINLIREGNKRFDLFKMLGSDEINLKPQEKISGLETLNLVTEFLSELGGTIYIILQGLLMKEILIFTIWMR